MAATASSASALHPPLFFPSVAMASSDGYVTSADISTPPPLKAWCHDNGHSWGDDKDCEGLMINVAHLKYRKTSNTQKLLFFLFSGVVWWTTPVWIKGFRSALLCHSCFDAVIFTLYSNDFLNNSKQLLIWGFYGLFHSVIECFHNHTQTSRTELSQDVHTLLLLWRSDY